MFIESSFCHKLFIAEKKPFFLPANQKQIFLTHCNGQNALVFSLVMIVSLVGRNGSVSREQGVFHLLTQDLQEVLQEPPPTHLPKKKKNPHTSKRTRTITVMQQLELCLPLTQVGNSSFCVGVCIAE